MKPPARSRGGALLLALLGGSTSVAVTGAVTLAVAGAVAGCAHEETARSARPDVIVVVIDTLRADRLPFYGHPVDTAPFLSELAERSLVCDNAWSTSSWTAPATASLFTSLHPFQHGVETGLVHYEHHRGDGALARPLPDSLETLPEVMQRLGYRTFGITDNVNIGPQLGFDRGFERFRQSDYAGADGVNRALAEWAPDIRASQEPTFVYLHYMDPHEPYHLRAESWREPSAPALALGEVLVPNEADPPRFYGDEMVAWIEGGDPGVPVQARARQARAAMLSVYDSEIGWVDRHVREAFELLGEDGGEIVVVAADHGEEFGDHGRVGHDFRLYDELVRVPLLLRVPGGEQRGRVTEPISLIDVLPTLRALLDDPRAPTDQGRSLLDPEDGRTLFAARVRFEGEGREEIRAARHGRYKAILLPGGTAELYDLVGDPGELANLATLDAARLDPLQRAWSELLEGAPRIEQSAPERLELDPAAIEHLRELGYTGD